MKKYLFWNTLALSILTTASAHSVSLVGTWSLLGMDKLNDDGSWTPRCHTPQGLITYTDQGYMAVGINCMKEVGSKDPSYETKDLIFYTGTYSVKDGIAHHQVKNSSDPFFYGKELTREIQMNADGTLTLIGKGKDGSRIRVLWKKASK